MYGHRCLENIKKLYKSAGKCDDQQQYKGIIESEMVSTPKGFTDNSPISPSQSVTMKHPSVRKPLCRFQTHWNSNLILISAGFVPLNQSTKESDPALYCGPVYQRGGDIQKSINRSKKLFTIRFQNSLRLCCIQYQIIVSNYPLNVK